jgi:SAM-dependent methyltransferase
MSTSNGIRTDLLACPNCLHEFRHHRGVLACTGCDSCFPVSDGIPCFAPTNDFYDAYADEHCPYALSPSGLKGLILHFLPFWSWREWQFWRKVIPACNRLLDLGCGRGRQLFAERAKETVGFDSSLHFTRDCAAHYDTVAIGMLPKLPFNSGIFDAVVSSHLMGHISTEHKETMVAEIARTLRRGGITAHIIETDSNHPIVAAAKVHPETYRKQFIEQDGHIGLEPVPRVLERFERSGFRLLKLRLVDAILPSLQNFRKYLNHPDFSGLPGMTRLRRMNHWTTTNWMANAAYEVGMGIFHRTLEQWFGNPTYAQFILVAFVKS